MFKYITFNINTLEDIKMGSEGSQKDTEYALSYIAGSSLRGAYIGNYIRRNNIKTDISEDANLRNKLLKNMKFLNAYPLINNKRSYPFPCCFYADKKQLKLFNTRNSSIPLINEFDDDVPENYKRVSSAEFFIQEASKMECSSVQKIFNLHITKQQDNGNLFRYEAIKKGQTFQGIIQVNTEDEAEVGEAVELLKIQSFILEDQKAADMENV